MAAINRLSSELLGSVLAFSGNAKGCSPVSKAFQDAIPEANSQLCEALEKSPGFLGKTIRSLSEVLDQPGVGALTESAIEKVAEGRFLLSQDHWNAIAGETPLERLSIDQLSQLGDAIELRKAKILIHFFEQAVPAEFKPILDNLKAGVLQSESYQTYQEQLDAMKITPEQRKAKLKNHRVLQLAERLRAYLIDPANEAAIAALPPLNWDDQDIGDDHPEIPPEILSLPLTNGTLICILYQATFCRNFEALRVMLRSPQFDAVILALGGEATRGRICSSCLGMLSLNWQIRGKEAFQYLASWPEFQAIRGNQLMTGLDFNIHQPTPATLGSVQFLAEVLSLPGSAELGGDELRHMAHVAAFNGDWHIVEEVLSLPRASEIFGAEDDLAIDDSIEKLAWKAGQNIVLLQLQLLKVKYYCQNHPLAAVGSIVAVGAATAYAWLR